METHSQTFFGLYRVKDLRAEGFVVSTTFRQISLGGELP